jgi:hemolysin type calcium-binding protein
VFRLPSRAVRAALSATLVVFALVGPGPRPVAAAESLGSVIIVQSTPSNPSQAFGYTSNVTEMSTEFYLDQDPTTYPQATEASSWVTPGEYQVTQIAHTGWKVGDISCSDPGFNSYGNGDRTATIRMDADEEIVCTFTNVPATGDVNIHQVTNPQDPTIFHYTTEFSSLDLADDGDESGDGTWRDGGFAGITEGSYTLTQQPVAGFPLTDITCSDPDDGTSVDVASGTVTLDIDADDVIDCTFTNGGASEPPAPSHNQVNITLDTVPNDPVDVLFNFGSILTFSLDDDADGTLSNGKEYNDMDLGAWQVKANVPAGWQLRDIACTDADGGVSIDTATATATLNLSDGETINCTYSIEPIPAPPPAPLPECNGLTATIVGGPGATTIRGTAGDDVIVDLDGANRIDGRGGNDTICTGNDDDVITGGAGEDMLFAGGGKNKVDGGDGGDTLVGFNGDDTLAGGAGNDFIYAHDGRNSVTGGSGDDFIWAGSDNDRIDGGRNFDTLVSDGGTDTVRNVEAL